MNRELDVQAARKIGYEVVLLAEPVCVSNEEKFEIYDTGQWVMRKTPEHDYTNLPYFSRSLDACVKYIVPWLEEHELLDFGFWKCERTEEWICKLATGIEEPYRSFEGKGESPALALCKAFMEV